MSGQSNAWRRKVNESVREIVAEELTELTDPGIGFVTITGVDVAPDLRNAKVYYSAMGTEEEREETAAALDRAAPRLQAVVGRSVRLKYTPRLHFEVDPSIDQGLRISSLLAELSEEDADE